MWYNLLNAWNQTQAYLQHVPYAADSEQSLLLQPFDKEYLDDSSWQFDVVKLMWPQTTCVTNRVLHMSCMLSAQADGVW